MAKEKSPDSKSQLEQLVQGLLALSFQRQIDEPHYYVIDRESFDLVLVNRRRSYSGDIERLLRELRINSQLISKVEFEASDSEFTPEQLINYHLGAFFDLVHQLKDKIRQLTRLMMLEETPPNPNRDPGPRALKAFFRREENKAKLEQLGLTEEFQRWTEEVDGPIGKTLKRRTMHHHYLAKLELKKEFQDIKTSRLMLSPTAFQQLSPYGKQYMEDLGTKSFEKFKSEVLENHGQVLEEINKSVESIASHLIEGFSVPTDMAEIAKVFADYSDFLGSFKVKNEASLDKLDDPQKKAVQQLIDMSLANKDISGELVAVYLVGSLPRGEFEPGISDFNFYLITHRKIEWEMNEFPLQVIAIDEEAFMSKRHKKDRFICWSDGVLIHGKALDLKEKDFPRPGSALCILLNEGYIERLEAIKTQLENVKEDDVATIRRLTLRAIKIMFDFDYGVAMANKPYYTASRAKKIEYTKQAFKDHKRTNELKRLMYAKGVLKKEDLAKLINIYINNTKKNYEKIVKVVKEFESDPN
ncbi:MAG TPA: hypothetical protein VFP35_02745 [Candidatus Saccharimonadales bacterium]|nr:hypothetical protein [Candidatus Saccharimonadales bacterium]